MDHFGGGAGPTGNWMSASSFFWYIKSFIVTCNVYKLGCPGVPS
jgi:hypothetical protein